MAEDGVTQEQSDTFRMGQIHSPSMQQQIIQLERKQTIAPTFKEAWGLTWDKSEFEPGLGVSLGISLSSSPASVTIY